MNSSHKGEVYNIGSIPYAIVSEIIKENKKYVLLANVDDTEDLIVRIMEESESEISFLPIEEDQFDQLMFEFVTDIDNN